VSDSHAPSGAWLTLRIFLPFVAGYFMSYVFRSINALVGPQIALELGLGAADLGLLTSLYFLAFAVVLIPFGMLLDRYGPRRVDAGLLLVAALGAFVFAYATSFAGLALGRLLIGLGVSVSLMASFQAFVLWYPLERIGTLNSRAFAVGILGAIAVSVPLEAALRVTDWRTITLCFAVLTLAASAIVFFVVPERARIEAQRPAGGAQPELAGELAAVRLLLADPAFQRTAAMAACSQSAVVSLTTLWMSTWLRDVAGYDRAAIGRALFVVNIALIAGFLAFGWISDARARRGASPLPVVAGALALASACLALLALGSRGLILSLWAGFAFFGSAATLGYSILSRRFPKHLAGRANTALNTFIFAGMFLGQWGVGLVLERWPRSAAGYAPEAYFWAFGLLWLAQLAGLAWF